jgi:hypothetical protein
LDCRTNFAEDDGYASRENLILFPFGNFVWIRFHDVGSGLLGALLKLKSFLLLRWSWHLKPWWRDRESEGQGFYISSNGGETRKAFWNVGKRRKDDGETEVDGL